MTATWRVLQGDVMVRLRELPDESVHCVVTSPPYWGLRDYGVAGQLGLESTPEEYVEKMVAVFREVRRVLRSDGTAWVNMGDAYAASRSYQVRDNKHVEVGNNMGASVPPGLKPKDLVGVPWMLAFALRADGWWLRSDIIWAKPNPMPESVTDRPTKSHEYVFLLAKSAEYFFDQEAVREKAEYGFSPQPIGKMWNRCGVPTEPGRCAGSVEQGTGGSRNLRTVWTIPTQPFPEAHFATFPEALVERCVKAGTSEKGCCATCGAPWERVVEVEQEEKARNVNPRKYAVGSNCKLGGSWTAEMPAQTRKINRTTGWRPTCVCAANLSARTDLSLDDKAHYLGRSDVPPLPVVPSTVLDPFSGSGTTGVVALRLGRSYVGIELNEKYVEMSRRRLGQAAPLFAEEIR